jgi:proline iminopeptidase
MKDLRVSQIVGLSLLLALRSTGSGDRATSPSPNDVFRSVQQIVIPDGIQEQRMLRIGGIDQWISIRGLHRDDPILLFLHGGPGMTSIPASS